jgi:pimeloyl-ACP methyl ester carboxylesterase
MKPAERNYYFGNTGQRLHVQEWGDIEKPVILLVHGFPGCAEHGSLMTTTPLLDQFRLISMDRPGYARSDFQKKLTPIKFAEQTVSLLNFLKIDSVAILSVSGGAPFALAVAFLLKDRVRKLTSVAGVAPLTLRNCRFMNSQQRKAWVFSNFVPRPLLAKAAHSIWKANQNKIDKILFTNLDSFSKADQVVFRHPVVGPMLNECVRISLSGGPSGIVHDLKIYSKNWGFSLKDIKCPITLWHGSDDDVVHFRFAQDMKKNLPHADYRFIEGEGHYSLPMNCRDLIISDLLQ